MIKTLEHPFVPWNQLYGELRKLSSSLYLLTKETTSLSAFQNMAVATFRRWNVFVMTTKRNFSSQKSNPGHTFNEFDILPLKISELYSYVTGWFYQKADTLSKPDLLKKK